MIRISIPSFRKIEENDKSFTVFLIEVILPSTNTPQQIEKRYSEFEDLHKKLKKKIHTPDFPPKKVLKWSHKVLEHRRQDLEVYLQGILDREVVPKPVMKFLEVASPRTRTASFDSLDRVAAEASSEQRLCHQPVLGFTEDPFLYEASSNSSKGSLPDIIAQGTYLGLYGDEWR